MRRTTPGRRWAIIATSDIPSASRTVARERPRTIAKALLTSRAPIASVTQARAEAFARDAQGATERFARERRFPWAIGGGPDVAIVGSDGAVTMLTAPAIERPTTEPVAEPPSRDGTCPCGSGEEFRQCHGAGN